MDQSHCHRYQSKYVQFWIPISTLISDLCTSRIIFWYLYRYRCYYWICASLLWATSVWRNGVWPNWQANIWSGWDQGLICCHLTGKLILITKSKHTKKNPIVLTGNLYEHNIIYGAVVLHDMVIVIEFCRTLRTQLAAGSSTSVAAWWTSAWNILLCLLEYPHNVKATTKWWFIKQHLWEIVLGSSWCKTVKMHLGLIL